MCACLKYLSQYFWNNIKENSAETKNTEKECVICLEKQEKQEKQEKHDKLQHIDKYMYNRTCKCNYYIHENCFHTWSSSHYYNRNNNKMNCLICNSLGNIFVDKYNNNDIGFFEMILLFLYYDTYISRIRL